MTETTSEYRSQAERSVEELISSAGLRLHAHVEDIREIVTLMLCQAYHAGAVAAMDRAISRVKAVQ